MTKTFKEIAAEVGGLVTEKNAAYGDSFAKTGEFLRLLYPTGITPDQFSDALCLVRIFDKQMRIATKKDALGESPWVDCMGYALLAVKKDLDSVDRRDTYPWRTEVGVPLATKQPLQSDGNACAGCEMWRKEIAAMNKGLERLKSEHGYEKKQWQTEIADLRTKLTACDPKHVEWLQSENRTLGDVVGQLKMGLSLARKRIEELESQRDKLAKSNEELAEHIKRLQSEMMGLP